MASSVTSKSSGEIGDRHRWIAETSQAATRLQNTLHLVDQFGFSKLLRLKVGAWSLSVLIYGQQRVHDTAVFCNEFAGGCM
jgi:hypothetical protein